MYCIQIVVKVVIILDNWQNFAQRFTKIVPTAYENMQKAIAVYEATGLKLEDAQLQAFKDAYHIK